MEQEHCDELNKILWSKPHLLERYGILTLICMFIVAMVLLYNYEYEEQLPVEKLEKVCVNNESVYKIIIPDQQIPQTFNHKKFNLIKGDNRVECENLTGISTNCKYILCKSSNENDNRILDVFQLSSNQCFYIETKQKYFDIIISPFYNLIQK